LPEERYRGVAERLLWRRRTLRIAGFIREALSIRTSVADGKLHLDLINK
jgi:hypothetical protein